MYLQYDSTLGCPGTGESSPALQANMQHASSVSAVQDLFLLLAHSDLFCNDNTSTPVRGDHAWQRRTIRRTGHTRHFPTHHPTRAKNRAVPIPLFLALLRHHRPSIGTWNQQAPCPTAPWLQPVSHQPLSRPAASYLDVLVRYHIGSTTCRNMCKWPVGGASLAWHRRVDGLRLLTS